MSSRPETPLLDTIQSPADIRALPKADLPQLSDELRQEMISAVSQSGGHLGSGLGVVELTVAIHHVFETPRDKLIWDVGHQAYPHKIVTGRRDRIRTLRQGGGLSGFTRRSESEYDPFGAAHSSTSISAALGFAIANKLSDQPGRAIAVIGDGAMSAGMAYTKFYSPVDAQFLVSLLEKHHIPYTLEHEVNQLDKVYLGEQVEAMYALKIPNEKFNHVNHLLAEQATKDMSEPGFEHLMQTYSVSELQEIIHYPDGWNAYDLQVATTLLSEKLQAPVTLPSIHKENFKPVRLELIWILLGYIVSILGASYLFYLAIAGFLSGLVVNQAKKTLKDGSTVKMYDQWSRMHGRIIMILASVCMAINFILIISLFKHR